MSIYIPPFWVGVIVTVITEIIGVAVYAILCKEDKEKKND